MRLLHGTAERDRRLFARNFFPKHRRDALPQVPCCKECNAKKSELENYLMTVFGLAAMHLDAPFLLEQVPRRLEKNMKLRRELAQGMRQIPMWENGMFGIGGSFPFRGECLHALFGMIVRGLAYHHWQVQIPRQYAVQATAMNEAVINHWNQLKAATDIARYVNANVGNGAFVYEGFQSRKDPNVTGWLFSACGGLTMAGDSNNLKQTATLIFGVSVRASKTEAGQGEIRQSSP